MTPPRSVITGRWMRSGEQEPPAPIPKICKRCDQEMHAKGLCRKHYEGASRLSRGMKPHVIGAKCRLCERPHMAMGLCGTHYSESRYYSSVTLRFRHFLRWAKDAGRSVSITKSQYADLTSRPCAYCGGFSPRRSYCGLDRIDSNGNYDLLNLSPCCWTCNYMKRDMTLGEWVNHIKKVLSMLETHA